MSIIRIQITHDSALHKEELSSILYNEIGEENNLTEDNVLDLVEIESILLLPNGSFTTILTINLDGLPLIKEITSSYLTSINYLRNVKSIVKLQDDELYEVAQEYYKKLFQLEMELRGVLTYILDYDNKAIGKETFKEFGINLAETFQESDITSRFENGLYYILFNHYASFSEPQRLKAEKISELLQSPSIQTFDDFNRRIERRFISEERHTAFLFSIKEKLKPLEKMRNSIMHIRNLTLTVISNFEKAAYDSEGELGIHSLIENFWTSEQQELNEKTWLAQADFYITRLITVISDQEGNVFYKMNDDYYDYEFEEMYEEISEFNFELREYLKEIITIPYFDSQKEGFDDRIDGLIDELLIVN